MLNDYIIWDKLQSPVNQIYGFDNSLKDLKELSVLCPLNQFIEPKLLPYLYRYCRDCLNTDIQASQDGTVKCALCKQDNIPENGLDVFKTDFYMKSMLEFVNLQNYVIHVTWFNNSQMFADHQTHILKLDNIESWNLTLEKLTTLAEDPRWHIHLKKRGKVMLL